MRVITSRYTTSTEFLNYYTPATIPQTAGEFFVRTWLPLVADEAVVLDVSVDSVMERVCVDGIVVEPAAELDVGGKRVRGARIRVCPDEEEVMNQVMDLIEQDLMPFAERALSRADIQMEAESREIFGEEVVEVGDFSPGGVFLVSGTPPDVGHLMQLRLVAPEYALDRVVMGEVAWCGQKGDEGGFGVRFVFKSRQEKRQWRGIYARLDKGRKRRAQLA